VDDGCKKLYYEEVKVFVISIITPVLFFLTATSIFATNYYVSPTGNDQNNGTTTNSPWKTTAKVNVSTFHEGDTISFNGGYQYVGGLYFDNADKGSSTNPITITSYGNGKAIIEAKSGVVSGNGFFAYNTSGFSIKNINFVSNSSILANSNESGINFYNDLPNDTKLDYIRIHTVEVSGFPNAAIIIGGWNNKSGFNDVRIEYADTHDNGVVGISLYGQSFYANKNVYVGYSKSYHNQGISGAGKNTGNGIVLGSVSEGMIEKSIAYDNGEFCDAAEGPVGIWTYDSDSILIQFNESYRNKTKVADGDGFDFDQNVTNSIMQYNYSHDNDGAGFLQAQGPNTNGHQNTTIRYNISQNDARRLDYAAIQIWGSVQNTHIYNNTVYLSPSSISSPKAFILSNWTIENQDAHNVYVRNNIFQTTNGIPILEVTDGQLQGGTNISFQGNNYYSSGGAFKILWGTTNYTSLNNWRATNQEKLNGSNVGYSLSPLLTSPEIVGKNGFLLQSTSPMVNKGLSLNTLFQLSVGFQDLYGNTIPQDSAFDIGAHEYTNKPIQSGDANGDGKVDGIDYISWLSNYGIGNAAGASQGDFNLDAKVDGVDYIIWLSNYGL
jgi:hypothetical protein